MSYMHVRVHEHTDGYDGTRDHSAQDRLTPSCTAFIVEAASPRAEFNQGGITAVKTDKRDKREINPRETEQKPTCHFLPWEGRIGPMSEGKFI